MSGWTAIFCGSPPTHAASGEWALLDEVTKKRKKIRPAPERSENGSKYGSNYGSKYKSVNRSLNKR